MNRTAFLYVIASAIMAAAAYSSASAQESRKSKTVGWVENVRIQDVDVTMRAKLDTGAKTSSLDARVLDTKENPNPPAGYTEDTVVFSILDDTSKKARVFERDVVRYVRIKLKGDGYIRRPVVKMTFCIAGRLTEEEVNLAERTNFIYPVLIGRNMMQHANLLINASRTFMTRPVCENGSDESSENN